MSDGSDEGRSAEASPQTRSRRWLCQAIGWDGVLPLAVAVLPEVLLCLPLWKGQAELIMAATVLVAGLGRSHIAHKQLKRMGHSSPPWWRQILLAVAICLLVVIEMTFGLVLIEGDALWPGILIVLGEYLVYLAIILVALRPSRNARSNERLRNEKARD